MGSLSEKFWLQRRRVVQNRTRTEKIMTCDSEDTTTTTTPKKGAKRRMVEAKWDMPAARSEAKRARKMEIETEFRILKSLIPNIANKQQINELEIIDACVTYIEALQDQLNIRQSRSPVAAVSNDMSEEVDSVGGDLEPDDLEDENDENEAANGGLQVWPVSGGAVDSESDELSDDDSEDEEEAADSDMKEEEEEENNNASSSKKTDSPSTTKDVAENEEDDASSSLKSSRRPPTSS